MSDEGKALVRRMYDEVWNEGHLEIVDDICASDYVGVGPYGDERGPDAVKRGVAARRSAFPDISVTIEDIAATGKRVRWSGIWIYRIARGKFVERWHSYDMLGLLQQLKGADETP